jgi:hypothetical protein
MSRIRKSTETGSGLFDRAWRERENEKRLVVHMDFLGFKKYSGIR